MAIENADQLARAMKTVYNILAYADNTEAALRRKLKQRGFSPDVIDSAVERACASGALNEERMLESRINYLINTKKFGRRRVEPELRRLGFPREAVAEVDWDGFDFVAVCAELIRKTGGLDERVFASLLRKGFSPGEIKAAARLADET